MSLPRIILLLALCVTLPLRATHIVGGELYYDHLGTNAQGENIYRITLKIFRDCGPGTAEFDGINNGPPARLSILNSEGEPLAVHDIGIPVVTLVPPAINSPCMAVPNTVCVQQGIYTYTLTLPPRQGGYWLIYQRCCRNHSILNLTSPGTQGSTYYSFIPGPEVAAVNSSPRFSDYPPIFLCNGFDLEYNQAATDPDGDQLVYKFSTPYQGLDVCCPALGNFAGSNGCVNPPQSCPVVAPPPPYAPVNYSGAYNALNPAPANPPFAIHPVTGAMSGAPAMNGQFVINVAVEEYRHGVLLNVHFRDFQFNMLPCDGVVSQFRKQEKCQGLDFTFANTSFNGKSFLWDFGVPGMDSDTSRVFNPQFIYPDTGTFIVTLIVNPGDSCTDSSQHKVRVYPPLDIGFERPEPQCLTGNLFSFSTEGTYGPFTKFRWRFGNSAIPPVSGERDPAAVTYSTHGTYLVQLHAAHFACLDSITDTLRVLQMPVIGISDPGHLCEPATVTLTNRFISDQPLDLKWKTSTGVSANGPEAIFQFRKASTYTTEVVGTLYGMCTNTAAAVLKVNQRPVAQFDVNPRTVSILEPEVQIKSLVPDAVMHNYVFSDGTSEQFVSGIHSFRAEGEFLITQYVSNFFGCIDSASTTIKVVPEHRFWMPDAFTPDNDDLNDTFGPFIMGVSHFSFEIFDRWGGRIFHTTDPERGWDGMDAGKPCPQGVYTFMISFKDKTDGTPVTKFGHVTLLRSE